MVKLYVRAILNKDMDITDVPDMWRSLVQEELDSMNEHQETLKV